MAKTEFDISLIGKQSPPAGPFGDAINLTPISIKKRLQEGNSTDEVAAHVGKDEISDVLAASATIRVDLTTDLDRYGVALAATDVVFLFLIHKTGSASSSIHAQPAAVEGWTSFMGAGTVLTLKPGDFVCLGSFTAANQPVVAGVTDAVEIVNDDGSNAANYELAIGVRR